MRCSFYGNTCTPLDLSNATTTNCQKPAISSGPLLHRRHSNNEIYITKL